MYIFANRKVKFLIFFIKEGKAFPCLQPALRSSATPSNGGSDATPVTPQALFINPEN